MSDAFYTVVGIYIGLSAIFSLLFHLEYYSLDDFKRFFTLKEVFWYIWFAPAIALVGLVRFVFGLEIWDKRIFYNEDMDKK